MQIVEVCDAEFKPHCPCCGKASFNAEGDVKPCKHLVFVGSSETPDESWYESVPVLGEDDFENLVKVLKRKFRRPEYVMFLLFQPAPAALEIYAVYRLTDARE